MIFRQRLGLTVAIGTVGTAFLTGSVWPIADQIIMSLGLLVFLWPSKDE